MPPRNRKLTRTDESRARELVRFASSFLPDKVRKKHPLGRHITSWIKCSRSSSVISVLMTNTQVFPAPSTKMGKLCPIEPALRNSSFLSSSSPLFFFFFFYSSFSSSFLSSQRSSKNWKCFRSNHWELCLRTATLQKMMRSSTSQDAWKKVRKKSSKTDGW